MRISGIQNDSIVDGDGVRLTIFTQGCPHHCEGCHNPETWDFNNGYEVSTEEIIDKYNANKLLDGVTFSGGEPLSVERFEELIEIAEHVHKSHGNIWCYTGYTYEELIEKFHNNNDFQRLLNLIDVLVDGRFELPQRTLSLKFRGSSNQRILKLENGIYNEQ